MARLRSQTTTLANPSASVFKARPRRTVFKFRGEDAPAFGLGSLGAELEHTARQNGGSG